MNNTTLLPMFNEIANLNERLPRLQLSHIGNAQFMQELEFLHQAVETLIDSRQNADIYSKHGDEIETNIEVAGTLEDRYNAEYQRRRWGN